MEKQKRQKITLLILLVVFVLSLGYRLVKQKSTSALTTSPAVGTEEELTQAEIKDENIELKKVEYKGGNLTDPLKNRFFVYLADNAAKIKASLTPVNLPSFRITGLIWNSDRPQAIINGSVVSVGDEIQGAKLLSVEKNGIKVEYKGTEFFIKNEPRPS